MKKNQKWALKYRAKDGSEKTCYPRTAEKRDEQLAICKERGIEVISCKKLYPFNTYANQHNFCLISTLCYNAIHDMENGETEWDGEEYDRLAARKEKAEDFSCLPLPVAWLPYDEWKEAKEMAVSAVIHRQDACIANGRPELVSGC